MYHPSRQCLRRLIGLMANGLLGYTRSCVAFAIFSDRFAFFKNVNKSEPLTYIYGRGYTVDIS